MLNLRKQQLCSHYWYPPSGLELRCLVFLSHGFSEHLGLYQELGEYLSEYQVSQDPEKPWFEQVVEAAWCLDMTMWAMGPVRVSGSILRMLNIMWMISLNTASL